jgi:hypothetical protein
MDVDDEDEDDIPVDELVPFKFHGQPPAMVPPVESISHTYTLPIIP